MNELPTSLFCGLKTWRIILLSTLYKFMLVFNTTCVITLGIMTRYCTSIIEKLLHLQSKIKGIGLQIFFVRMGSETYTTITTFSLRNMICRRWVWKNKWRGGILIAIAPLLKLLLQIEFVGVGGEMW